MYDSAQKPLHPAPHKTALWLAKISIGLLLGSALWLMGVRVYENKICVDTFPSPKSEPSTGQPSL
jgi:hypothetical protein